MAPTTLSTPVTASLVSIRFFNGRMLTGDDLTREQRSLYARDERVAAALGSGIVRGLEVSADASGTATTPAVRISAGAAIDRRGEIIVLESDTVVQIAIPVPAIPPPRPDWRRCAEAPSDLPASLPLPDLGLYLLVMRPRPVDSAELARVLQADRSNDPCMVSYVQEAAVFRLIRMIDLETAVVGVDELRLRNVVAHACFGTAGVPPTPASDAPASARAIDALRSKLAPTMDWDVPLAILRISRSTGLTWIDAWSARRSVAAESNHATLERVTGPRSCAEAEARLLQFDEQVRTLATPVAGPGTRTGSAVNTFQWLPPAAELPANWVLDGDAWRHFLGPWMAPPALIACDARVLPALLTASAAAAAVPVDIAADAASAPALDVYSGRTGGEGAPTALIYVQSALARVLVELTGAALTPTVITHLHVRLVSADGLRSWDMIQLPDRNTWVSPGATPGDYSVQVVSIEVAASPVAVALIGGRVHHREMTVTAIAGSIEVETTTSEYVEVFEVLAKHDGQTLAARRDGPRWIFDAAVVGTWAVTARAYGRLTKILTRQATVEVQAGQTAKVVLSFEEKVKPPPHSLTFTQTVSPGKTQKIKLSMIETSITDLHAGLELELKPSDFFSYKRAEYEAAPFAASAAYKPTKAAKKTTKKATKKAPPPGKQKQVQVRSALDELADDPMYVPLKEWAVQYDPGKYVVFTQTPDPIKEWLRLWQLWLAYTEPSEAVRKKLLDATPILKLEPGKTLLALANLNSPPNTAECWAVFGPTSLPVAVTREAARLPVHYTPADYGQILDDLRVIDTDIPHVYPIDELIAFPKDYLDIYFPWPIGDPDDFYQGMMDRTIEAKVNQEYVPGMTPAIRVTLGGLAKDPVAMANATPAMLANLLKENYDPVITNLLLANVRQTVDAEKWSIGASGLDEALQLEAAGYTTIAELAASKDAALGAALHISEPAAQELRGRAAYTLGRNAVADAASDVFAQANAEGHAVEIGMASPDHQELDLAAENQAAELSPAMHLALETSKSRLKASNGAFNLLLNANLQDLSPQLANTAKLGLRNH